MSETLRTFVGVRLPASPELRSVLRSLAAMNWPVAAVSPDEMHVTLKFLGDTPTDQLEVIQQQIGQAVAGQTPFAVRLEGVGAFPNVDRPSVLWVGLMNAEPLETLAERLDAALEPLGFPRESRPFHPHLTLARIKGRPPRDLFELLCRNVETPFGTAEIRSVEFLKSDLRQRAGSRYSTLSSYELRPISEAITEP